MTLRRHAQISHLESTRDNLQKQNNESISKRSALHETIQATKIELKEWYDGYQKLQKEKQASDDEVKALSEEVKAGKGSGEELQRVKDELENAKKGVSDAETFRQEL